MIERRKTIRLALVSSLILTVGWVSRTYAATSVTLDILPDDVARTSIERVEVGNLKPFAGQSREAVNPSPSGNPLWFVPLSVLIATRERPIFSTSRRPPQLAVAPRIEPVIVPIVQTPSQFSLIVRLKESFAFGRGRFTPGGC
jgi:general secretion pathway protein N